MRRQPDPAARWRGAATGLLTAALAVGAHSPAAGAAPTGSGLALLVLVSTTVGALAASTRRPPSTRNVLVLLACAQVAGHLALATADHQHAAGHLSAVMATAHAAAVAVGALLITAADRLWQRLCTTTRKFTKAPPRPPAARRAPVAVSDQPLRRMLVLAASVSRRGPPVVVAS